MQTYSDEHKSIPSLSHFTNKKETLKVQGIPEEIFDLNIRLWVQEKQKWIAQNEKAIRITTVHIPFTATDPFSLIFLKAF